MPTAMIDGLEVNYVTRGSGPALLMLAPGGFDATIEKWSTASAWKGMRALEVLASEFTVIAYDRRESGASAGRVEHLSWSLFAAQAKGLLDHLGIREAFVLGGCMGCSVALAFAARFPQATRGLLLHWPVGGYRWKLNGQERFARHLRFARENGLAGVVKRAHEGKSFWQDSEAGPWGSVIVRDPAFAASFEAQDLERYLGLVTASARGLFDRDTVPGAEPEEIMAMKVPALIVPGDDPSHATSGAHYLRELLPQPEFWPVMPPEQTQDRLRDRILEFGRAHK
ncbi:MAG: alpha/beta hydrolase [Candidatus Rokubacteria bacterium]|nr:alpha/beta hydrolase [Candidatus Rokubacteria bacterium]